MLFPVPTISSCPTCTIADARLSHRFVGQGIFIATVLFEMLEFAAGKDEADPCSLPSAVPAIVVDAQLECFTGQLVHPSWPVGRNFFVFPPLLLRFDSLWP